MPHIVRLQLNVRIKRKTGADSVAFRAQDSASPAMPFMVEPVVAAAHPTIQEPVQRLLDENPELPKKVEPREVADIVYRLMRDEARTARQRGKRLR